MSDNVVKMPSKSKLSWAVYVPGERMPMFFEATDFYISEDHILYLSNGPYRTYAVVDADNVKNVVAIFHHWDYVERVEERESA